MAFRKTTEPNIGNRDGGGEVMSNAEGTKLAKDMDYGCILCRMDCFRHEERVLGGRPPAGCEMHTSATRPVAPPGRKFQQMSYMSQMSQMTAKHTVQVVAPPKTSYILSYSSSGGRPPAGCEMHTSATRPVAPPGRKFQQMSYMSQMSQMTAKHTVQVVAPPKTSHILSYSSSGGRPPAGCEMHTPATRPAFMM